MAQAELNLRNGIDGLQDSPLEVQREQGGEAGEAGLQADHLPVGTDYSSLAAMGDGGRVWLQSYLDSVATGPDTRQPEAEEPPPIPGINQGGRNHESSGSTVPGLPGRRNPPPGFEHYQPGPGQYPRAGFAGVYVPPHLHNPLLHDALQYAIQCRAVCGQSTTCQGSESSIHLFPRIVIIIRVARYKWAELTIAPLDWDETGLVIS